MSVTRRTARLGLNQFDDRLVPAVLVPAITLDGHQLWVHGTDMPDKIHVTSATVNGAERIRVEVQTQNAAGQFVVTAHGDFAASRINSMRLEGLGGDDRIVNDTAKPSTIYGGAGNDTLYGGSADDEIHGGDGNDWIYGRGGNDRLYAGEGQDHLFGGAGNDTLTGGSVAYKDWLEGDSGNDTFVFQSKLDSHNRVVYMEQYLVDFTPGHDKIHINGVNSGGDV
jgi:Ca2+-binding RTX toxin-like protein